jgi:hypothetical protein
MTPEEKARAIVGQVVGPAGAHEYERLVSAIAAALTEAAAAGWEDAVAGWEEDGASLADHINSWLREVGRAAKQTNTWDLASLTDAISEIGYAANHRQAERDALQARLARIREAARFERDPAT